MPIVEPEVLMDGDHDIDTCMRITEWALKELFQELYYAGVKLEGTILKPNMVVSGKKCAKQASREEVAEKTLIVLKRCVPSAVPGIAFLSGGQSEQGCNRASQPMNALAPCPGSSPSPMAAPCRPRRSRPGAARPQCRGGPARLLPSRRDECACLRRQMVEDPGKVVNAPPLPRGPG